MKIVIGIIAQNAGDTLKDWEKEFDKKFAIGSGRKWFLTVQEANEFKSFIRSLLSQERQQTIEEIREKVEGVYIYAGNEKAIGDDVGLYNQAINDILALLEGKEER